MILIIRFLWGWWFCCMNALRCAGDMRSRKAKMPAREWTFEKLSDGTLSWCCCVVLHQKQVLILFGTFVPRIKQTTEEHNRSLLGYTSLGSAKIITKSLTTWMRRPKNKLVFVKVHHGHPRNDGLRWIY